MLKKNILLFVIVIYLITALLGYRIGSVFQYDELRLLQFPLALCALLILISAKTKNTQFIVKLIFIIGVFILIQHINWGIFEFQELWSAIALLLYFLP